MNQNSIEDMNNTVKNQKTEIITLSKIISNFSRKIKFSLRSISIRVMKNNL